MAVISLAAGSTTLVLNGRVYGDLVDGDNIILTPVNPLTEHTRSRQGVNIQERSDARVMDVTIPVAKYSDDDNEFNAIRNTSPPVVLSGTCKEILVKDGVTIVNTYTLRQGSMTVLPTDTRNNQTGNNSMTYGLRFNSVIRA